MAVNHDGNIYADRNLQAYRRHHANAEADLNSRNLLSSYSALRPSLVALSIALIYHRVLVRQVIVRSRLRGLERLLVA